MGERSIVLSVSVCLCVCLCVYLSATISSEPHVRSSQKFLCTLPMAVAGNLPVKKKYFFKSIKIWQNYGHESLWPHFFGPHFCVVLHCYILLSGWKTARVLINVSIYLSIYHPVYFSTGNGQPEESALCHLYRHTFLPRRALHQRRN